MRVRYIGASARGPLHSELGSSNQDAWKGAKVRGGVVIAVADGMGSKPLAALGARKACAAAITATGLWWKSDDSRADALPDLIESHWRASLGSVSPDDARTTCLVAGVSPGGAMVVAALGDGVALVTSEGCETELVTAERTGFGNETHALGRTPTLGVWRVSMRSSMEPGTVVMLATDGVADDLVPDRRPGFAREIVDAFGDLPPWRRRFSLWRALRAWPTPGHTDDKTVAVLWRSR